jgi:mannose-1-phosphate guanylyltransferase
MPEQEHVYCVIMAGGKGERFWPLSTRSAPKPFVRLLGSKSMIQTTLDRALALVPAAHVLVAIEAEHLAEARNQLPGFPDDQFVVEPVGRDTAPCLGLTALLLKRRDPEAVMIVLPADHYVPDIPAFVRGMSRAVECSAQGDFLVTVGVRPTRPEKGYGYIGAGPAMNESCFLVDCFVEKPDEETAVRYLAEGGYFWNSGIFVWKVDTLLKAVERHMPDLHRGLGEMEAALASGDELRARRIFPRFESESIDYGLMEKADNVLMVIADFAWDDMGTWGSLRRVTEPDEDGNHISGRSIRVDTRNCVIYGEGMTVGTIGVSDLIIVASGHGVLVCSAGRDQETRKVAQMLDDEEEGKGK